MSPRDYHLDRASTPVERQRRFRERHQPKPTSLARIGEAPPTRKQKLDAAALQPRPEQFSDRGKRLGEQRLREHADVGFRYVIPVRAFDTWVPTRRSGGRRQMREASPVLLIPVTPELERKALEDLANCEARDRKRRRW